jgi:hypothetical protein
MSVQVAVSVAVNPETQCVPSGGYAEKGQVNATTA